MRGRRAFALASTPERRAHIIDGMMRRAPEGIPLLIALDPNGRESLTRQIYLAIRDGILAGRLAAGTRLPSTRALATDLGVSRNTVVVAFDQLIAEGYIESHVGRGTRVGATIPDHLLRTSRAAPASRPTRRLTPGAPPTESARTGESTQGPSGRGRRLVRHAAPRSSWQESAIPFSPGVPALDLFPWRAWARLVARRAQQIEPVTAGYGDVSGYLPLREAISRYVAVARGVVCVPEQVIVVGGSQQALDLVSRVVTDPGDAAWIEDPGYHGALGAFSAAGLHVVGVPVDAGGISVEAGRARAPGARVMYVTPSHQFPLGVTMSLPRRLELLEAAKAMRAWIVEDDYDSEFRYISRPLTALQGLDPDGRVVYVGTFSKVMFPALRIGYLIAPTSLLPALTAARQFAGTQQAVLEQMVLTDFITQGHFERHVRRMRNVYEERQHQLIDTLRRECGALIEVEPAGAGMHLMGWLPPGVDDRLVSVRAAAHRVDAIPLSAFAVERGAGRPGLLLGYSHIDRAAMQAAARRLTTAIREAMTTPVPV